MRSLETLSKSIFRLAGRKYLRKIRANSLESVLKNSIKLLDQQTIEEIGLFLKSQQTPLGGFSDRGGKCDLYYTLFGYFVAEAIGLQEVIPALKGYVRNIVLSGDLKGVHLNCAIILYVKLFEVETLPANLREKLVSEKRQNEPQQAYYSLFLELLTSYYTEDYFQLYKVQKALKKSSSSSEMPCSVTSAHLIIQASFGKQTDELISALHLFYRKDGSFAAVKHAPIGDLLSTGVALYALKFVGYDHRIMKPDCLNYIDSLYSDGGFCATVLDPGPDVEYTFYGLLALGALAE
ncbi:MAG: prenyltransferase/squalene oxidase repeat-containing protein [Prolixibacteraceae bacterium]